MKRILLLPLIFLTCTAMSYSLYAYVTRTLPVLSEPIVLPHMSSTATTVPPVLANPSHDTVTSHIDEAHLRSVILATVNDMKTKGFFTNNNNLITAEKEATTQSTVSGGPITIDGETYFAATHMSSLSLRTEELTSDELEVTGETTLKKIYTENMYLGTSEHPVGLTLYDTATQEASCIHIEHGVVQVRTGACQ